LYHHALDWLPCPLIMRVLRRLECDSHAHDPARGTPLTLLITVILCVLVIIVESVSNEQDNFQEMFFAIGTLVAPVKRDTACP
jgi:hypothetical protein